MTYYGLDVHKRYTVYTEMAVDGTILRRGRLANNTESVRQVVGESSRPARVVLEATGNWAYLAGLWESAGAQVVLAHPRQVRAIAAARVKTDAVDATTLAHLLRSDLIPEAYRPPPSIQERRARLRYRQDLVKQRTALKNRVHALLTAQGLLPPLRTLFGRQGRAWLQGLPLPASARQGVDGYLAVIDALDQQIGRMDAWVKAEVAADGQAQLLCTIPGIGAYTALTLLAEVGQIRRFPSARHLASYMGLAPRVRASGGHTRYGGMSKEGSSLLRWLLVEAAQRAARQPGELQRWHRHLAQRRGFPKATVALARRLVTIVYAVLCRQEPYRERGRAREPA